MSLGNAANQLEGTEGIVALAGKLAQHRAVFLSGDLSHGFRTAALGSTVGIDEEHRFALGQILPGKLHDGLLNVKAVDAGGKADAVILFQPDRLSGCHINEVEISFISHGIQYLSGIPMVAGVVTDSGFHPFPSKVQLKSLW